MKTRTVDLATAVICARFQREEQIVESFGESTKRSYEMNKCLSLVHLIATWRCEAARLCLKFHTRALCPAPVPRPFRGIADRFAPANPTGTIHRSMPGNFRLATGGELAGFVIVTEFVRWRFAG